MGTYAEHPKQRLLFFVADDIDDSTAREMERLIEELANRRVWSTGPPVFVDEIDDSSMSLPEDFPVRTLGGVLDLYSTRPPEAARLPKEMDQANLDEVKVLVKALVGFSLSTGHEIEFELDEEPVGSIRKGEADRMLRDGFLGEWERELRTRG